MRKNEPALIPPFFRERTKDPTWEISENQAVFCIYILFFLYLFYITGHLIYITDNFEGIFHNIKISGYKNEMRRARYGETNYTPCA